jgi:hypothetical protein
VEKNQFWRQERAPKGDVAERSSRHYYDSCATSVKNINHGQQVTNSNHQVPANTLLAYLCFPQGFQLWGDRAGTRGSDCTVFAVTENLVKITVRLNGAIICWPEGITLKSGCDDSPARLQLYQQLLENNLKARSFAQTFESAYGTLNNVFLLDLLLYDLSRPGMINVELEYSEGMSKKGAQTMLVWPVETCFKRLSGDKHWNKQ